MTTHPDPDDTVPVLGTLPPAALAAKLRAMGDPDTAAVIEQALAGDSAEGAERGGEQFGLPKGGWWPFNRSKPAYLNTAIAVGYLPVLRPNDPPPIRDVGNIVPDLTLRGARIKITLLYLRAADYPGGGMHQVLFDFAARNQVPGTPEDVHFTTSFRIAEGQRAPVRGYPIFVGLTVGPTGVAFSCTVVNVYNEGDRQLLGFLDSDVFRAGLQLATVVQPALKPLTAMAVGLTQNLLAQHENAKTQEFQLGLDFTAVAGGALLAEGAYIVVQIPESAQVLWNWDDWAYLPGNGQIVAKRDLTSLIPYNYLILGVSRYTE